MTLDGVLEAGFADPVFESQSAFRALMRAMARPGLIEPLSGPADAPSPLSPTAAAIALTLADGDTPVWLDPPLAESEALKPWLAFHAGAPVADAPSEAAFAFVAAPLSLPPLDSFALGCDSYPDRSTTVVLQVDGFGDDGPPLTGPGILGSLRVSATPLPADFWDRMRRNRALFPRGVDVLLAGPDSVVALPRSLSPGSSAPGGE